MAYGYHSRTVDVQQVEARTLASEPLHSVEVPCPLVSRDAYHLRADSIANEGDSAMVEVQLHEVGHAEEGEEDNGATLRTKQQEDHEEGQFHYHRHRHPSLYHDLLISPPRYWAHRLRPR